MDEPAPDPDIVEIIPLVEEALRLGKRRIVTGRVRVSTHTEKETRAVRETLRTERADIERLAVGRELAAGEPAPTIRHEADGTLVIPVLEEVLVVETRLVLREEIRVRITSASEPFEETVTIRKQRVAVERLPGDGTADHTPGDPP